MDKNFDGKKDAAVLKLLCLSNQDYSFKCNCIGELQTDELIGWRTSSRGNGDTTSLLRNRSLTKVLKKTAPTTTEVFNQNKGAVYKKQLDSPFISGPETCLLSSTDCSEIQSHADHVAFYTKNFASTKDILLTSATSMDQPYELKRGDLRGMSLRMKIIEMLLGSRMGSSLASNDGLEKRQSGTLGMFRKSSDLAFGHRKKLDPPIPSSRSVYDLIDNAKSKRTLSPPVSPFIFSACQLKKEQALKISRIDHPLSSLSRSKKDCKIEASSFRPSKSDFRCNKKLKSKDGPVLRKATGSVSSGSSKTESRASHTRPQQEQPAALVPKFMNNVVLSYNHS